MAEYRDPKVTDTGTTATTRTGTSPVVWIVAALIILALLAWMLGWFGGETVTTTDTAEPAAVTTTDTPAETATPVETTDTVAPTDAAEPADAAVPAEDAAEPAEDAATTGN